MPVEGSDAEARSLASHVLLVRGLVVLALGIVAIAWPDITVKVVAVLLGIVVAFFGAGMLAHAFERRKVGLAWIGSLIAGLIVLGLGLAAVFWPGPTVVAMARLFGLALVVSGFLTVLDVYAAKDSDPAYAPLGVLGILGVIFGIVLLVWPDITIGVLVIVQGIFWVIGGILSIYASRKVKTAELA